MRNWLVALPLVFLVGCKTSLFDGLSEDQANRIVAVLSHYGISSGKERNADKTWSVEVEKADAVAAIELASAYALPRGGHTNLGELFKREGFISSPEEDRVRYVFGLTQELSDTLEKIDGVLVARVHIVEPERDPLTGSAAQPSASVLLRYRSDYNIEALRDKVRALVAGSVEGLTPERVSLTLVSVTPAVPLGDACGANPSCVRAATSDGRAPANLTLGALALMALLLIVSAWVWRSGTRSFSTTFFRRRGRRGRPRDAGAGDGGHP